MAEIQRLKPGRDKDNFVTNIEDKELEVKVNTAKTAVLKALESTLVARQQLIQKLGYSYDNDRDLYTALGYPETLSFDNFKGKHKRQDISKTIIEAPVKACWRRKPKVTNNKRRKTKFEKSWQALEKRFKVFHYLSRVDIVSGIGRFGVLLLGFKDGKALDRPVTGKPKLIYLRPYSEGSVAVKTTVTDVRNPRYGLPETYEVSLVTENSSGIQSSVKKIVHHSRVLHIADGMLENDVYGTPRLEACYNRLMNLDLIAGGSAEMFWRGAFPGYSFEADGEAQFTSQDFTDLQDEIEEYMHGLKRYLRTQGLKVNPLTMQVASPSDHVEIQLMLISGATGIPVRILIGSERGELSSSQDDKNWNDRIIERRDEFVEPWVLRPFIDKMIETGNLPSSEYEIEWPDLQIPSDNEVAEIARKKAEAISRYIQNPAAVEVIPPEFFCRSILGVTEEEWLLMQEMDVPELKYLKQMMDQQDNRNPSKGTEDKDVS